MKIKATPAFIKRRFKTLENDLKLEQFRELRAGKTIDLDDKIVKKHKELFVEIKPTKGVKNGN